jgi:hypothetical protein
MARGIGKQQIPLNEDCAFISISKIHDFAFWLGTVLITDQNIIFCAIVKLKHSKDGSGYNKFRIKLIKSA